MPSSERRHVGGISTCPEPFGALFFLQSIYQAIPYRVIRTFFLAWSFFSADGGASSLNKLATRRKQLPRRCDTANRNCNASGMQGFKIDLTRRWCCSFTAAAREARSRRRSARYNAAKHLGSLRAARTGNNGSCANGRLRGGAPAPTRGT